MSDSEEEITERQFKIALVGDPEVGKTSIATRYASGIKVISCLENYTFSRSGIVSKSNVSLVFRYLRKTVYTYRRGGILPKKDHLARPKACNTQGNQLSVQGLG